MAYLQSAETTIFIGQNRFGEDALKNRLQKRGPKKGPAEQALYKNVPLGGPQINPRPFCGRQTSENVVFRERGDFGKMPILHSSAVLGRTPPTKYSQGFLDFSRGGQKTGKKQCFLVVSCGFFFLSIVSSWSPVVFTYLLAYKCVIHPCFLTCDVMLSFFAVVVFPCFYSSLYVLCSLLFIWLFVFVVFCLGVTETQIKSENISKF